MRKDREQRRGAVKAHGKGVTLAVIRRCKELTQPELGALAGVSESLIALVETGRRQPSLDNALAICAALDVPVDALFDVDPAVLEELADSEGVA